jgi:oligoendopeptidase F
MSESKHNASFRKGTFRRLMIRGLALALPAAAAGAQQPAAEPEEKLFYEDREQIPIEYRWDLSAIHADRGSWQAAFDKAEAAAEAMAQHKGKLAESPQALAAALEAQFEAGRPLDGVFVYANELLHTNLDDTEAKELSGAAQGLASRMGEAVAFVDPEIVQMPEERLTRFLEHPEVARYAHYIDNVVRVREHILSPEVEEILAGASLPGSAHRQAYSSLQNADIEWPTIVDEEGEELKVVPGQYIRFVTSEDRRVRREGSLALFDTFSRYANTFAATLGGNIQRDVWMARTRGYDSTLEMALDDSNVPRAVVDTLVETVHDNIDKLHGYAALRKKIQGLDDLHVYDLYVNLLPGIDKRFTFEEGWALALEFWRETFGPEYAEVAERGRRERWIDVYTNEGKRPGAYNWGTYDSHPYLFLNWSGKLEDVSTLVHEMGHAIHMYMAHQNQPYHYSSYSLFVAEVASVASESLFLEWLLQRTEDPDERKQLLNQAMNGITGTFVRQIFFHEWEAAAHAMAERGEPLTKESLGKAYGDLWRAYYGEDLNLDEAYEAGWARVSHFYRTFYVWVYATSYAAGEAIAERFRQGDETAVEDYLAMLKLGGSVYPMEALERAVIGAVMSRYGELQERLAEVMLGDEG